MVVKEVVEKKSEGERSEIIIEDEVTGYTIRKFIDKNSHFRRTKNQILNEPNPKLLDFIKPTYPILKKTPKKEKEMGLLKKFREMLNKI